MNYPFKDKFTVNPQQDAEGFTMPDARCHGCAPADMCPRSGHCDRYMSPLRETNGIPAWMVNDIGQKGDALRAAMQPVPVDVQRAAYRQASLREHGAARLPDTGLYGEQDFQDDLHALLFDVGGFDVQSR